jgi:anti-sigma B factor antagonist
VLSGGARNVVVNLGGVAFMDSSGLSVLVAGMKGAREAGGEMAIACASEPILKIFAITGLDRLISIHPSVTEAVAS